MAITVIGGLTVSTLLTLVVIPIVYDLLDRRPDEYYAASAAASVAASRTTPPSKPRVRSGMSIAELSLQAAGHHDHVLRVDDGDRPDRGVPPAAGAVPRGQSSPFVFVNLPYAGLDAARKSSARITRPVEEALATMPGIKTHELAAPRRMAPTSSSSSPTGTATSTSRASEARDRIDAIRVELPDDLQRYFVHEVLAPPTSR